ncbi:threonine/serine ThrE exporter family protein [Rudaeicoccus suwonensis]|uniref:Uncharacterized membrane protein YjjP (DUF1212 family) n=1 Tax=Rudaeicoccus suwonensis TaxID=657409 RepID=A0A561EAL9_9MICO|nr:threonine/serine exporter family protein [Rudaeicoccus suwonensis]TWE12660.1 uncharacterized membrane protein YjjP (DUF1212 family) [Rudaeicoccus suwonensis]
MTNAAAPPPSDDVATPDVTRDCLLQVGAALLAGAAPVPDVEAQLTRLGARMGVSHVRVAATPTGVFVATTPDQVVGFESVSETLRFEQMTRVQQVVDNLGSGQMRAADAVAELADIEAMPASRPGWLCDLAILPISVGICAILQPTWRDLVVTAAGALLVAVIVMIGHRSTLVRTLQPLLASFGVGCVVLTAAQWWPLEGTLRTLVCSIAVLLPGSMIVTGMSEVASGAAVAGTARLVSGGVQLVLFAVGVFTAVAATGVGLDALTNVRASDLGPIAPFAGVALVGAGIVVNVAASRPAIPWICGVLVLTFGTQWLVQNTGESHSEGWPAVRSRRPRRRWCIVSRADHCASWSSCRPSGCWCPAASACSAPRSSQRATPASRRSRPLSAPWSQWQQARSSAAPRAAPSNAPWIRHGSPRPSSTRPTWSATNLLP